MNVDVAWIHIAEINFMKVHIIKMHFAVVNFVNGNSATCFMKMHIAVNSSEIEFANANFTVQISQLQSRASRFLKIKLPWNQIYFYSYVVKVLNFEVTFRVGTYIFEREILWNTRAAWMSLAMVRFKYPLVD